MENKETVIEVSHATVRFNLASEKIDNLPIDVPGVPGFKRCKLSSKKRRSLGNCRLKRLRQIDITKSNLRNIKTL